MSDKKILKYFCEDCGHLFEMEVEEELKPENLKCFKCGSEFVNHDLDRSLFENLGVPEMDKCDPDNCRSCRFRCELFAGDDEEESDCMD